MNREEFEKFLELVQRREEKHYAWLRQLLLVSSGALSVLVSLGTGSRSEGMALLAIRTAWGTLGFGILLVSTALYGEVHVASSLVRKALESDKARRATGAAEAEPIHAMPPKYCAVCERWGCRSLATAVLALVAFAMMR